MPASWLALDVPAGSQVSTTGALALVSTSTPLSVKGRSPLAAVPDAAQQVSITAQITTTGRKVAFTSPAAPPPSDVTLPAPLPGFPGAVPTGAKPAGAASRAVTAKPAVNPPPSNVNPATTTYDPDRTCSVPRNSPNIQSYQPSQQQIEWAVDQAVQGKLTGSRGSDLYGSGLPAYTPQGMFPAPGLTGGGSVPAQVLLGILAQESNEGQASPHAIIGQTGNFLPSFNWYGDSGDFTYVNWAATDCGYGIAQVTTGMCMAGNVNCGSNTAALPYNDQLAAAVDYQANIAAGLQILEQKWNQLYSLGIKANGANPKYVENWWLALWAYNSGLQPNAANGNTTGCSPSPSCTDAPGNGSGGNWGLGWLNNPINPMYPPDREMFLSGNYNYDEANPQGWSYEEKVIGFGAYGYVSYSYLTQSWGQSYAKTLYPSGVSPFGAEAPHATFCTSGDNCNSSNATAPCQLTTDHCWWHQAVTWNNSPASYFGTQVLTYAAGAADPGNPGGPAGYAPACTVSPLPSNAVIVGDTASSIPAPLGCGESWSNNGGTMTWNFAAAAANGQTGTPATYPSKIDLHQIGGGYSGHFWFTHTIPSGSNDPTSIQPQAGNADLVVTGTWTPPSSVKGWTRIMVAIPNEGAWEPQANYQINLGNGTKQFRVVNQARQADTWVDLGTFNLTAGGSVSLSNVTYEGLGYDIAWDATAFISAAVPSSHYVALGDSYAAGEGVLPFRTETDYNYSGMINACHRSASGAYPDLVTLPGQSSTIAKQATSLSSGNQFASASCTGAETTSITENAVDPSPTTYDSNGNTDWGRIVLNHGANIGIPPTTVPTADELPQADQGWLRPDTTLVTLTIGGNDARFPDVVTACTESAVAGSDCSGTSYYLTRLNGAVDPSPLYQFEPQVIQSLQSHLYDAYAAVSAAAPNADIIVLGYPRIFPGDQNPTGPCSVDAVATLGIPVVLFLNQMGDLLNQEISGAVAQVKATGANIHYIDPNSAFTGHEICSSSPWINGVVSEQTSGSGTSAPGTDSFHPTAAGQQAFATLVDECIAGKISC
jgi:lysophospholipase L1-like esterase